MNKKTIKITYPIKFLNHTKGNILNILLFKNDKLPYNLLLKMHLLACSHFHLSKPEKKNHYFKT